MIKIISILIYVIFIFHSNFIYAENYGYIWFPVAWAFSLGDEKGSSQEFYVRSVKLNFRNINENRYIYTSLDSTVKNQKQLLLSKKNFIKTVYSSKLLKFPVGEYEFIGASAEIKVGNNEFINTNIPYIGPYVSNENKKLQFIVSENNISPFPSLSAESKLYAINNSLGQKTLFDSIDDEAISIDPIRIYLKSLGRKFSINNIGFQVANQVFPALQSSGSYLKTQKSYYLGLIIDIPCKVKGSLKFIWANKKEPIQYSFLMKLNHDRAMCKDEKFVPQKFYFPEGTWLLQSMTVVSINKKLSEFNTYDLKKRIRTTKNYFKLNDLYYSNSNHKERALLKVIEINLYDKVDPQAVYFLGSSEIKKNEDPKIKDNYLIYFKRNYEIIDVRKLFSVKRVYNAYTSEVMKKDRIRGTINLKIDLIGNDRIKRIQDKYLSELKEFSSAELANCVAEQEIQDPLMVLNGVIKIKNIKRRTSSLDFSKNDIIFAIKGKSQEIVRNCLEEKLRNFQFSRPINPPFQANISFESL
ncbi:hypothetical protein [Fluviispira multicolorata]|uniref:Uncharacterized protein n=1 Tax=Fluviispira multicolorata TaxID=2654512 RepID=A0A833JDB7_9BACT|nr:hypothetical protein [Fluviispira multicolorata]KAB8030692.1 hypothetical protein GCL57_06875 [Fluviispira multicolorata]